jgi:hypothetical protein
VHYPDCVQRDVDQKRGYRVTDYCGEVHLYPTSALGGLALTGGANMKKTIGLLALLVLFGGAEAIAQSGTQNSPSIGQTINGSIPQRQSATVSRGRPTCRMSMRKIS